MKNRSGLAVAVLALVLVSAGTATATHLITGADVKDNSLTGRDIRNGSLSAHDFTGLIRGPRGLQGPQGPAGPPGAPGPAGPGGGALAYAKVEVAEVEGEPFYTLVPERSKNVNAVSRTGGDRIRAIPGVVCVDLNVAANVATVTPMRVPTQRAVIAGAELPTKTGNDRCPSGTDASISLKDADGEPTESGFFVIFD